MKDPIQETTEAAIGQDQKTIEYTTGLTPPKFETQPVYDLTDPEQPREWLERNRTKAQKEKDKALAQASVRMLFSTDISKLDDAGVKGLYQSVTEGVWGMPDSEGAFFGKRGSKDDFRRNVELLRAFFKGNYALAEDEEAQRFRKMDWAEKFEYAREHESAGNALASIAGGERGASLGELVYLGAIASAQSEMAFTPSMGMPTEEQKEIGRKINYDTMTPEEKHNYEADIIGDYERKLAKREPLFTYVRMAADLSDEGAYILAKSYNENELDVNGILGLPEDEQAKVMTTYAQMKGDLREGNLLWLIPTDFSTGTAGDRLQMGVYGLQQSVVSLGTDLYNLAEAGTMRLYAQMALDGKERKDFYTAWNTIERAKLYEKKDIPEADSFIGKAYQSFMENVHWIVPYGGAGKLAKWGKGASAAIHAADLSKELKTAGKLADLRQMMNVSLFSRMSPMADGMKYADETLNRLLTSVDKYTRELQELERMRLAYGAGKGALDAAWVTARGSAFAAFAQEYLETADAAGISREESVLTAVWVGLLNDRIEQLYVPGLESTLTKGQLKSLGMTALRRSFQERTFGEYAKNFVTRYLTEGARVGVTEGWIEEPLQQLTIEHGKAVDQVEGLDEKLKALLKFSAKDVQTYLETAVEMLPASVGFGVTTVPGQLMRRRIRNRWNAKKTGLANYDEGIVGIYQRELDVRKLIEASWQGKGEEEAKRQDAKPAEEAKPGENRPDGEEAKPEGEEAKPEPTEAQSAEQAELEADYRATDALTRAREIHEAAEGADVCAEIAKELGLDVKTAEAVVQLLDEEAEVMRFDPRARSMVDQFFSGVRINEDTIGTLLPGYVAGSFEADEENGVYVAKVKVGEDGGIAGGVKTIVYRRRDGVFFNPDGTLNEAELARAASRNSSLGKSYNQRLEQNGNSGLRWEELSEADRRREALILVNGRTDEAGAIAFRKKDGSEVTVRADAIINLATGRLADIGYGMGAKQATVRHETFHALWKFARELIKPEEVKKLADALAIDTKQEGWEDALDEAMAHQMEEYASGHYVMNSVSSRFEAFQAWAAKVFGGVDANRVLNTLPTDRQTQLGTILGEGTPFALEPFYEAVMRGKIGSGEMGIDKIVVPAKQTKREADKEDELPVEGAKEEPKPEEPKPEAKPEEPAPAEPAKPTNTMTRPGWDKGTHVVKRVERKDYRLHCRLEVVNVFDGVRTSWDADFDQANQGREMDDQKVAEIAGNLDYSKGGRVMEFTGKGAMLVAPNMNVLDGNHHTQGIREGYRQGGEKAAKFREDCLAEARERGLEVSDHAAEAPVIVCVIESVEAEEGQPTPTIAEIASDTNETSQEELTSFAKAMKYAQVLLKHDLIPRFRIDPETGDIMDEDAKTVKGDVRADPVGIFVQQTHAKDIVKGDKLTEQGREILRASIIAAMLGDADPETVKNMLARQKTLDMENEQRALMRMAPGLMALVNDPAKKDYDLRPDIVEALLWYQEWRDHDEEARRKAGKTKADWRARNADGSLKEPAALGTTWENYKGDLFSKPGPAAQIIGDLFAASQAQRSFKQDGETDTKAGMKRAQDLIVRELEAYLENVYATNTDTNDMFGDFTPPTKDAILQTQREKNARYSVAAPKEQYDAVVGQYKGTDKWLKAPNGKPSNLDERQWVQVRTPAFKAWFGDWENDPANASKVVDENGEPLVVYHGGEIGIEGREGSFQPYHNTHFGTELAAAIRPFYRITDERGLPLYTVERDTDGTWSVGVNEDAVVDSIVPDPVEGYFDTEAEAMAEQVRYEYQNAKGGADVDVQPYFLNIRNPYAGTDDVDQEATPEGYDGIRYVNKHEDKGSVSWVAKDPEAIKSADYNDGGFSGGNPDIRYSIALYHGTGADFREPSLAHVGEGTGVAAQGHGFYVTDDYKWADFMGHQAQNAGIIDSLIGRRYVYQYEYDGDTENLTHWVGPNPEAAERLMKVAKDEGLQVRESFFVDPERTTGQRMERFLELAKRPDGSKLTRTEMGELFVRAGIDGTQEYCGPGMSNIYVFYNVGKLKNVHKWHGKRQLFSVAYKPRPIAPEKVAEIVEKFGVTDNIEESLWILPDGRMLKGEARTYHIGGRTVRTFGHDALTPYVVGKVKADENAGDRVENAMRDIYASGFIRMTADSAGLYIAKRPTDEQFDALYDICEKAYQRMEADGLDEMFVDVEDESFHTAFTVRYKRGTSARRMIEDLKAWYDDGVMPEGATAPRYSVGRLYTGSSADYDKPSIHKVGTGEGNTAYGWGLYASNVRRVAENYAADDAARKYKPFLALYKGKSANAFPRASVEWEALKGLTKFRTVDETIDWIRKTYGDDMEFANRVREWIEANRSDITYTEPTPEHVYEQTWWTNRKKGDESHLLSWYEPVDPKKLEEIIRGLREKSGIKIEMSKLPSGAYQFSIMRDTAWGEMPDPLGASFLDELTGGYFYSLLSGSLGRRTTSEALYEAGIDGIKYPVDSYGGKPVKDGDVSGWNYVAFSDKYLRVNHKWRNGQQLYSTGLYNPRGLVPRVRGGWTEQKIIRYLKTHGSHRGEAMALRLMAEFDSPEELKAHMFYHGTSNGIDGGLKPSIIRSENWRGLHGGGGYGLGYWGVSVSRSKKTAANFSGTAHHVSVHPIVLAKGAKVVDRPNYTDARDVEDEIVQLWTDGVDAVRIGNWESKTGSEEELLVLNPRAIVDTGNSSIYEVYNLGGKGNEIDIKDDEQIRRMFEYAKSYHGLPDAGMPKKPSHFTDNTFTKLKPPEVYNREMEEYGRKLREWQGTEDAQRLWDAQMVRHEMTRWSVARPLGENKVAGLEYPDAGAEIRALAVEEPEGSYSLGMKRRGQYRQQLYKHRPDLLIPDVERILDHIDQFENVKQEKLAVHWLIAGSIEIPEDSFKIEKAIKTAERAKVDPFQYRNPEDIFLAFPQHLPKEKPVDPDKVPELVNKKDMGHGITVYDIDESEQTSAVVEGEEVGLPSVQLAMREIINTHWGKDASPWCLLRGNDMGNLTQDALMYWEHYNALPKRVAFKDGKLLAFMATAGSEIPFDQVAAEHPELRQEFEEDPDGEGTISFTEWFWRKKSADFKMLAPEEWWDRQDKSHAGIPFEGPVVGGERGLMAVQELKDGTATITGKIWRGNAKNGLYEEWDKDMRPVQRSGWKNGNLHGECIRWWPNGSLQDIGEYRDGKAVGDYASYDEGGGLVSVAHYDENGNNDRPSIFYYLRELSMWTDYDKYGKRKEQIEYYPGGCLKQYRRFDVGGDPMLATLGQNSQGNVRNVNFYRKDGARVSVSYRVDNSMEELRIEKPWGFKFKAGFTHDGRVGTYMLRDDLDRPVNGGSWLSGGKPYERFHEGHQLRYYTDGRKWDVRMPTSRDVSPEAYHARHALTTEEASAIPDLEQPGSLGELADREPFVKGIEKEIAAVVKEMRNRAKEVYEGDLKTRGMSKDSHYSVRLGRAKRDSILRPKSAIPQMEFDFYCDRKGITEQPKTEPPKEEPKGTEPPKEEAQPKAEPPKKGKRYKAAVDDANAYQQFIDRYRPLFEAAIRRGDWKGALDFAEENHMPTASNVLKQYYRDPEFSRDLIGTKIAGVEDVAAILMTVRSPFVESTKAIYLDRHRRILDAKILSIGKANEAPLGMGTVARNMPPKTAYVVFSHNHPSGHPEPSGSDKDTTMRLKKELKRSNVKLLDHIITDGDSYYSFNHQATLPVEVSRPKWEVLPAGISKELRSVVDTVGYVAAHLRDDGDCGHVVYLSSRLGVVGVRRIPSIEQAKGDYVSWAQKASEGAESVGAVQALVDLGPVVPPKSEIQKALGLLGPNFGYKGAKIVDALIGSAVIGSLRSLRNEYFDDWDRIVPDAEEVNNEDRFNYPRYSIASRKIDWEKEPDTLKNVVLSTTVAHLTGQDKFPQKYLYFKAYRDRGLLDQIKPTVEKWAATHETRWFGTYLLAKYYGDLEAAKQIARHHMHQKKVSALKDMILGEPSGEDVVFEPLPVHWLYVRNDDGRRTNRIPEAYAGLLAETFGGFVDTGIVKVSDERNTGAKIKSRVGREFQFAGEPAKDAPYVIVDDVWTTGQTAVSLMEYLEKKGAKVAAITTLAVASNGSRIKPTGGQIADVLKKAHVDSVEKALEVTGVDLRKATGSELHAYIVKGKKGQWGLESWFGSASPVLPLDFKNKGSKVARATPFDLFAHLTTEQRTFGKPTQGVFRFSTAFPRLADMGDDQLIAAAHAVRSATKYLGRKMMIPNYDAIKRDVAKAYPALTDEDIRTKTMTIQGDAVKLARKIREGLDKGVSESAILKALNDSMKPTFMGEMRKEAKTGVKTGWFGAKAEAMLDRRLSDTFDRAIRVQAGVDTDLFEEWAGVDFTETLWKVLHNAYAESEPAPRKPEPAIEEPEEGGGGSEGGEARDPGTYTVKELENPRTFAEYIRDLAGKYWKESKGIGKDADPWHDRIAVQFLRKTAQNVYTKLVNEITYSRSRDTAYRAIQKMDNIPTVAGLVSQMTYVGEIIHARHIRETKQELCEKLDELLKTRFGATGRFKVDKEELKRKVSAEMELRARYMRHAIWLTPDAASEEAGELSRALTAMATKYDEAERDLEQSRIYVETIRKLHILREFGGLKYKTVGEIEKALAYWEEQAAGSSEEILKAFEDREERTKNAAAILAKAFFNPKMRHKLDKGFRQGMNNYLTAHMGFASLLQDMCRFAPEKDRAEAYRIIEYLGREIQKAGDRSAAEMRRHGDDFHKAVEQIYGMPFKKVMAAMNREAPEFAPFMGTKGGQPIMPTKGRAMQLLVSLRQGARKDSNYYENVKHWHREGQAAQIADLLTPQDMNMLKWIGQWYEVNRQELSDVCEALFGIGVYSEAYNYFPVRMQLQKQGLEKVEGVAWTVFPKALTPRIRNLRDFDTETDIFALWASRMEEASQWKGHAKLGLELRGIFGRSELQEVVAANHGNRVNSLMLGFVTDILAGHGAYDRTTSGIEWWSDQIRGWTALCALGGNVGVTFKQTTSIPAFGFEIGLVKTARYTVSAFTPAGMEAMRRIFASEQRKTRWQIGNTEAVKNALAKSDASWFKRAMQASMITNKVGDIVPGLVVGQGIYRDCLARGMSEENAMAQTWMLIERTQQSGRMENQTSVQRRNRLGRMLYQFLTTQQQYLQYEVRAIRQAVADPSLKNAGQVANTILLNHLILSSLYYWMGELYKAMLGSEPPKDQIADWVVSCLLGPFASLYVLGFGCKVTLDRFLKGSWTTHGEDIMPMESFIKSTINDSARVMEAVFDEDKTTDDLIEELARLAAGMNPVVRDIRRVIKNTEE